MTEKGHDVLHSEVHDDSQVYLVSISSRRAPSYRYWMRTDANVSAPNRSADSSAKTNGGSYRRTANRCAADGSTYPNTFPANANNGPHS